MCHQSPEEEPGVHVCGAHRAVDFSERHGYYKGNPLNIPQPVHVHVPPPQIFVRFAKKRRDT